MITALVLAAGLTGAQIDQMCKSLGGLAETVMIGRQRGIAMSEMMALAPNDLTRSILIDAFKQPRMNAEDNKRRQVEDFRARVEWTCYDTLSEAS